MKFQTDAPGSPILVVCSRAFRLKADIHLFCILYGQHGLLTLVIFYWPMVRVPDQADHHRRCSHAADGLAVFLFGYSWETFSHQFV